MSASGGVSPLLHSSNPAGPAGAGRPRVALPSKYTDPEQSGESREVKEGQVNTHDLHLE